MPNDNIILNLVVQFNRITNKGFIFMIITILILVCKIVKAQNVNLLAGDSAKLIYCVPGPSIQTPQRHYLIGAHETKDSGSTSNYIQQLLIIDLNLNSGVTTKHYFSRKMNFEVNEARIEYLGNGTNGQIIAVTKTINRISSSSYLTNLIVYRLNPDFSIFDSLIYNLPDTVNYWNIGMTLVKAIPYKQNELLIYGATQPNYGKDLQKRFLFSYNYATNKIISEIIKPISIFMNCQGFSEVIPDTILNRFTLLNYGFNSDCYELQIIDSIGNIIDSLNYSKVSSNNAAFAYIESNIYSCTKHNIIYALSVSDYIPGTSNFYLRLNIRKYFENRPTDGKWFDGNFDFGGDVVEGYFSPIRKACMSIGENIIYIGLMSPEVNMCFIASVDTNLNSTYSGFIPTNKLSSWANRYYVSTIDTLNGTFALIGFFYNQDSNGVTSNLVPFIFTINDPNQLLTTTEEKTKENGEYFTLFPNPATTQLHVLCSNNFLNGIRLLDIQGRVLIEKPILTKDKLNESTIEVNNLNSGVYLIEVITESDIKYFQKFIKQ